MHAYTQMTGKVINPWSNQKHDIKCTVNDVVASFTVTDNTQSTFGLFDEAGNCLGYVHERGIDQNYPKCASINGAFNIVVRDAPIGSYVKQIESFHLDGFGGYTKTIH